MLFLKEPYQIDEGNSKVIRRIAVMMSHLRRLLTRTAKKKKKKKVCECDKEDPRKDDDCHTYFIPQNMTIFLEYQNINSLKFGCEKKKKKLET